MMSLYHPQNEPTEQPHAQVIAEALTQADWHKDVLPAIRTQVTTQDGDAFRSTAHNMHVGAWEESNGKQMQPHELFHFVRHENNIKTLEHTVDALVRELQQSSAEYHGEILNDIQKVSDTLLHLHYVCEQARTDALRTHSEEHHERIHSHHDAIAENITTTYEAIRGKVAHLMEGNMPDFAQAVAQHRSQLAQLTYDHTTVTPVNDELPAGVTAFTTAPPPPPASSPVAPGVQGYQ